MAQHRLHLLRLAAAAADPWEVTTEQLEAWLSNPDWSPTTKHTARAHIRAFYKWAVTYERIPRSPAEPLPPVHVPRGVPRPTPGAVIEAAIAAADDRARLALMLAAFAGLRRAEIAGLGLQDVTRSHLIVTGKGGHQRMVPIDPHGLLASELGAALERCRVTGASRQGYLFPSSHGGHLTPAYLGSLVAAALPGRWTVHTLRHWFATEAYRATRDLRAVQDLLGHSRPETTSLYTAVPDDSLLAAVRGASRTRLGAAGP